MMAPIKCPTCGEPFYATDHPHMPFCSQRCQQIDMQRWMNEEQGLPIEDEEFDPTEVEEPSDDDDPSQSDDTTSKFKRNGHSW